MLPILILFIRLYTRVEKSFLSYLKKLRNENCDLLEYWTFIWDYGAWIPMKTLNWLKISYFLRDFQVFTCCNNCISQKFETVHIFDNDLFGICLVHLCNYNLWNFVYFDCFQTSVRSSQFIYYSQTIWNQRVGVFLTATESAYSFPTVNRKF